MKKNIILAILAGSVLLTFFSAMANKQSQVNFPTPTPLPTIPIQELTNTFQSKNTLLKLNYPKNWKLTDTTPKNNNGQFGTLIQTWTIEDTDKNAIINFELQQGGGVTQGQLDNCMSKTIICEEITINGIVYTKSITVLNTAVIVVGLTTIENDIIFRASARILPNALQAAYTKAVEQTYQTLFWAM